MDEGVDEGGVPTACVCWSDGAGLRRSREIIASLPL